MNETVGVASWAVRAWEAVLERVRVTVAEVGERFPLYADPGTGRWTTTARGSWTGGCWAGLLWLRALATSDPCDQALAADCTRRLEYWIGQDTAARGLVLWYGTALAAALGGDRGAAELRARAARACLAAYEPERGLVPWGGAFGGPRMLARADGVPGLVPLLATVPGGGRVAAYRHLTTHLELCLSQEPPRPAWRTRPGGGWTGYPHPVPGWSRTVAWLLLGAADGLRIVPSREGEPGVPPAAVRRLVALRLGREAPLVPPACRVRPSGPVDTSAAAIEAVAALKLAALARAAGRHRAFRELSWRAGEILRRLSTSHLSTTGGLLDGCYDAERGLATQHELIWGDFFLALGLAMFMGAVEPFAV
ncbi:sugar ABC transporter permease [Streptomyces noursei]|uniref:sugar ABC transporter permease n=1 Tax=Streptomyces noursei TaxID=1971 RepID=UPI0033FBC207